MSASKTHNRHGDKQLHFLQTLIDKIPNPIFYKDMDGYYLGCNRAFEEYHGITRKEIIGVSDAEVMKGYQKTSFHEAIDPAHGRHPGTRKYERSFVRQDGSERVVTIEEAGFTDPDGNTGIVGVVNDITGMRVAEREKMRVSKLESLGLLAGGIAHDFNNILTVILGNIALAKIYGDVNTEKLQRLLQSAEYAVTRAKDLTRQLLTFSRGGTPIKKVTSIEGILKNTTAFTLSGTGIRSEFDIAPDLSAVEVDENQIGQVVGNIVLNAQQAMPYGGTLYIRAENIALGNVSGSLMKGDYVKISIRDQGIGIPEEYLDKIFDPYFTTKEKGSGLGLSICHSIIQRHQGHIGVESTLGVCTTFVIYLPAAQTHGKSGQLAERTAVMNGNGKILVMDDEETIRKMVGDILQYLGYTVDFASDGDEALNLYSSQPYDAVILDLTIPGGMGGRETIRHLRDIDPAIKAIVSSGYSNDPIMSDYTTYGFRGVIVKPYTIQEISNVLRTVIS